MKIYTRRVKEKLHQGFTLVIVRIGENSLIGICTHSNFELLIY